MASQEAAGRASAAPPCPKRPAKRTLAELVELPGVGRKTANVVLGVAFGTPEGIVVDTHVQRLSQRLGLTKKTEPVPHPDLSWPPDLPGGAATPSS